MEEALRFFRAYELWVYLLLSFGGLIYIRKFILAWQELRGAAFGLERDSAQARLNQAASVLVLIISLGLMEFVLVSFIAPTVPGATPILTPTLDLFATPTTTLSPEEQVGEQTAITATATITPSVAGLENGCLPGQIIITSPANGADISGAIAITGTVNIPNFGFYKLEMKRSEDSTWLTILAGNEPKIDATLGTWNTGLLAPGYHQLSLVVTDNEGQSLPPCVIQVRVTQLQESP